MANEDVIFQPKGAGTEHKEGTILINAQKGARSSGLAANYTIDTYVSNLPTTGEVIDKYHYVLNSEYVRTADGNVGAATSGVVVDAIEGRTIEVVGYTMVVDAASTVTFQSNATPIFSGFALGANGGVAVQGDADSPLFSADLGQALTINNSAGNVSYHVSYVVV